MQFKNLIKRISEDLHSICVLERHAQFSEHRLVALGELPNQAGGTAMGWGALRWLAALGHPAREHRTQAKGEGTVATSRIDRPDLGQTDARARYSATAGSRSQLLRSCPYARWTSSPLAIS